MLGFKKKTYALVGRSGTGKSYRAQFVAAKYHIPLIIDDGLLIRGDKIIAGKSAKQAMNSLTAIKLALFHESEYKQQVIKALQTEKFHRILILGTSMKMVDKIADLLGLPRATKTIRIEDIATPEEIETAMRVRYSEGQHVIPVNPIHITRKYPDIAYDSVRVGLLRKFRFLPASRRLMYQEKTLVKTEFTDTVRKTVSSAALKQMVTHCFSEYDSTSKVENVSYILDEKGYTVTVCIRTPNHLDDKQIQDLSVFVRDSLERYSGILVNEVRLSVSEWS